MALSALTGNFDRKGGQLPGEHTFTHQIAGFTTLEDEFADGTEPKVCSPSSRSHQVPVVVSYGTGDAVRGPAKADP